MNLMRRQRPEPKNHKNKTKTPKNVHQIIEKTVQSTFLWVPKNNYMKRFLLGFSTACFVLTNFTQVIALYLSRHDGNKLFKCSSVLTFCSMGMLKQISLYTNSESWKAILRRIRKLETEQLDQSSLNIEVEYESDSSDFNVPSHIDGYTKRFKFVSNLMFRIYTATLIIYIISPFVEYGLRVFNKQEFIEYPHILPGWSPLDKISLIGYVITIFFEFIAAVYCVQVHTCFDLMTVGIIVFVCGQFKYLQYCCERIGGKGKSCSISNERDARALHRIKDCHYLHSVLLESIRGLNKLVKNILGLYFLVDALTLCSIAVQINSEARSVTHLISLFQYMLGILIQLFLLCSFGNDLFSQSSNGMGEGPYGSAYWCLSPKVQRQLLILSNGIMKPQTLQAGAFFMLNMPSFFQIIRTAYSYYAVIREKTQKA